MDPDLKYRDGNKQCNVNINAWLSRLTAKDAVFRLPIILTAIPKLQTLNIVSRYT